MGSKQLTGRVIEHKANYTLKTQKKQMGSKQCYLPPANDFDFADSDPKTRCCQAQKHNLEGLLLRPFPKAQNRCADPSVDHLPTVCTYFQQLPPSEAEGCMFPP